MVATDVLWSSMGLRSGNNKNYLILSMTNTQK